MSFLSNCHCCWGSISYVIQSCSQNLQQDQTTLSTSSSITSITSIEFHSNNNTNNILSVDRSSCVSQSIEFSREEETTPSCAQSEVLGRYSSDISSRSIAFLGSERVRHNCHSSVSSNLQSNPAHNSVDRLQAPIRFDRGIDLRPFVSSSQERVSIARRQKAQSPRSTIRNKPQSKLAQTSTNSVDRIEAPVRFSRGIDLRPFAFSQAQRISIARRQKSQRYRSKIRNKPQSQLAHTSPDSVDRIEAPVRFGRGIDLRPFAFSRAQRISIARQKAQSFRASLQNKSAVKKDRSIHSS